MNYNDSLFNYLNEDTTNQTNATAFEAGESNGKENKNRREIDNENDKESESDSWLCIKPTRDTTPILPSKLLNYYPNIILLLPLVYFFLNIGSLIILLSIEYSNKAANQTPTKPIQTFYNLIKIHPLWFKINTYLSAFIKWVIYIIIFTYLNQRFKVPEYKSQSMHNFFWLVIGLFVVAFYFIYGSTDSIETYWSVHLREVGFFSIEKFSYFLFTFTTLMYNIYLIVIFWKIISKESNKNKTFWFEYYTIWVTLVMLLWIVYIFVGWSKRKIFFTKGCFGKNEDYYDVWLPFCVYIANVMLVSFSYFIITYWNDIWTQRQNMDFLFIEK